MNRFVVTGRQVVVGTNETVPWVGTPEFLAPLDWFVFQMNETADTKPSLLPRRL